MMTIPKQAKAIALIFALFLSACERENKSRVENKSPLFIEVEKLAQQGNPEAQYHLGMMYNNGQGVSEDPQKAFEWFSKAADSGDPLAAYKMGCYFAGQFKGVVGVDLTKSLQLKLIAADEGYSFAQSDVGIVYFEQGNYAEAIKWWKLAAAQGYSSAIYNLSVAYNEGKVVPRDKTLAYSYFKLANSNSKKEVDPNAKAGLAELASTMTPDELGRAEQIVSEWKPEPTPLTLKAISGIEEAKKLVQSPANKP